MDTNTLYRELKQRGLSAKPGRIGTHLCEFLETRKQLVSCYATGSDNRRPPMWVLMRMCKDLGLELRVNPQGVVLTKYRRSKNGLGTKKDDVVTEWLSEE